MRKGVIFHLYSSISVFVRPKCVLFSLSIYVGVFLDDAYDDGEYDDAVGGLESLSRYVLYFCLFSELDNTSFAVTIFGLQLCICHYFYRDHISMLTYDTGF